MEFSVLFQLAGEVLPRKMPLCLCTSGKCVFLGKCYSANLYTIKLSLNWKRETTYVLYYILFISHVLFDLCMFLALLICSRFYFVFIKLCWLFNCNCINSHMHGGVLINFFFFFLNMFLFIYFRPGIQTSNRGPKDMISWQKKCVFFLWQKFFFYFSWCRH